MNNQGKLPQSFPGVFKVGTYTFPAIASISPSSNQIQSASITHSLGYVPVYLAFMESHQTGADYAGFPSTFYVGFLNAVSNYDIAQPDIINNISIGIDENALYLSRDAYNGNVSTPKSASAITVKYYILQLSAN